MTSLSESRIFPAKVERTEEMTSFVADFARKAGLHPKQVGHLELAVEEAVVNICKYAYAIPPGEVEILLSFENGRLEIRLEDGGIPFDPLAADEPDLHGTIEERPIGGLGIMLLRRFMHEVHYRREGERNVLTLAVRIA